MSPPAADRPPVLHAVVCAAPKDFPVLPLSISSIFRFTPVTHIAVITSVLPALQSFTDADRLQTVTTTAGRRLSTKLIQRVWNQRAQRTFAQNHTLEFKHMSSGNDITFIHEARFSPLTKDMMRREMKNRTAGNGPGWYLQQLFKLYAYQVLRFNTYLVVDADVVFTQPVVFGEHCDGISRSRSSEGRATSWNWPHCYAFWRQRKPSREDASYFQHMRCLTNGALKQVRDDCDGLRDHVKVLVWVLRGPRINSAYSTRSPSVLPECAAGARSPSVSPECAAGR